MGVALTDTFYCSHIKKLLLVRDSFLNGFIYLTLALLFDHRKFAFRFDLAHCRGALHLNGYL